MNIHTHSDELIASLLLLWLRVGAGAAMTKSMEIKDWANHNRNYIKWANKNIFSVGQHQNIDRLTQDWSILSIFFLTKSITTDRRKQMKLQCLQKENKTNDKLINSR